MAHPALFRAEVRFCDDAATPSSDIPTMIVYDTWEKPDGKRRGSSQALRNEMSWKRILQTLI